MKAELATKLQALDKWERLYTVVAAVGIIVSLVFAVTSTQNLPDQCRDVQYEYKSDKTINSAWRDCSSDDQFEHESIMSSPPTKLGILDGRQRVSLEKGAVDIFGILKKLLIGLLGTLFCVGGAASVKWILSAK
ncbi:MAG: hypothetical protein ABI898_06870 [Sphingomonadales bacterium]